MKQTRRFLFAASLAAAAVLSGCSLLGDSAEDVTEKQTAKEAIWNTDDDTAAGQDATETGHSDARDTQHGSEAETLQETEELYETEILQETDMPSSAVPLEDEAIRLLSDMTLEEKIGQMFFVNPEMIDMYTDGNVTSCNASIIENIQKYHLGGIVLFEGNILNRTQTTEMIAEFQEAGDSGLFIGVDEEGGIVSRIGRNPEMGCTWFPDMREIGNTNDSSKAYEAGDTIGREIRGLGFNLDFAPVADVATNPENTVIGNRSFSSDPQIAAEMVAQEIYGLHNNDIASSIKHFPGHGDTSTDSHTGFSSTSQDLEGLRSVEFLPFKAGIEAGTDMVMVSHIAAPAVTGNDEPASLSYEMITGLLRNELGYDGVVITDSLQMGAITEYYGAAEAVLASLDAGADIFLMPAYLSESYNAVLEAVQSGSIPENRIDESVLRILKVKINRHILT